MALDSTKVRAGITGAVYVGATGTTAPTSHNSALNAGFKDLGYLSEDGITEERSRSTDPARAWQNNAIIRSFVTEAGMTFNFTMSETKKETVELFYGTTVNTADGSYTIDPSSTGGRKSFVIDVIDGSLVKRIYIAEGELLEPGEVSYLNGEPTDYEVTITTYGLPQVWESTLIAA